MLILTLHNYSFITPTNSSKLFHSSSILYSDKTDNINNDKDKDINISEEEKEELLNPVSNTELKNSILFGGPKWLKDLVRVLLLSLLCYLLKAFLFDSLNLSISQWITFWKYACFSLIFLALLYYSVTLFLLNKFSQSPELDANTVIPKYLPKYIKNYLLNLIEISKFKSLNLFLDLYIKTIFAYLFILFVFLLIIFTFSL